MLKFSDLAKKYAPWSMSKANSALECSFAFNLKNVRHVKGTASAENSANRIGTAAHEGLELYIKNPAISLREALFKAAMLKGLTTPEIEELVSYAHNIVRFKQRLDTFITNKKITDMKVEYRFGLDIAGNPVPFSDNKVVFFRGIWDLLLTAESKHTVIIDHKSGELKDPKESLARYDRQRKLYSIAALQLFPQTIGVQTAFHYLQAEEVLWNEMDSVNKIRDVYFPWFVEYIDSAAEAATKTEPKSGWYCQFCTYTNVCPLKGRGVQP